MRNNRRNDGRTGTARNEEARTEKNLYGMVAALMVLFMFGAMLFVEHLPMVNLLTAALFYLVCGSLLLFSLLKLDVMEFQPGSFWYQLNQRVNREETATAASRQMARNIVYAMVTDK